MVLSTLKLKNAFERAEALIEYQQNFKSVKLKIKIAAGRRKTDKIENAKYISIVYVPNEFPWFYLDKNGNIQWDAEFCSTEMLMS